MQLDYLLSVKMSFIGVNTEQAGFLIYPQKDFSSLCQSFLKKEPLLYQCFYLMY